MNRYCVIVMTMREVIAVNGCASDKCLRLVWLSVNFMQIFGSNMKRNYKQSETRSVLVFFK